MGHEPIQLYKHPNPHKLIAKLKYAHNRLVKILGAFINTNMPKLKLVIKIKSPESAKGVILGYGFPLPRE